MQEAVEQASTLRSNRSLTQLLDSLEVEVFRLTETVRTSSEITVSPTELVRRIRRQGTLSGSAATALVDYLAIINDLISRQDPDRSAVLRALGLGESLGAYLHHIRLIEHLLRGFDGHGIWQWDRPGEANRYRFWSAVAAEAPRYRSHRNGSPECSSTTASTAKTSTASEGFPPG